MADDIEPAPEELGESVMVHRPDGHTVYINPRYIRVVREPLSSEQGKATIVFNSGAHQYTQETVEEVMALIRTGVEHARPHPQH